MFGIVAVAFDPVSARRVRASDPVACEPVRTNGAEAAVAGALESLDPVTVQAAPEFWCRRIVLRPARLLRAIVTSPAAALRRPKVVLNWLRGATLATTFRLLGGPVTVDETHVGGKEKHKRTRKKLCAGRGAVSNVATSGTKDGSTLRVSVRSVSATDREALHGFVAEAGIPEPTVYTDDATACGGMPHPHRSVQHSVGQYVNARAHTNGIESFWALLKRGSHGTYHHISEKHIDRHLSGFVGRHNARDCDTLDQMAQIVPGLVGKRMRHCAVIAH